MKRTFLIAICLVLLPLTAAAQSILSANLAGDGSGFASLTFAGDTVNYSILVSGIEPNAAFIGEGTAGSGSSVLDLEADFTNGTAAGSVEGVSGELIDDILASPGDFYVQVDGASGSASGELGSSAGAGDTVLYFPVVATVAGAAGTDFHTDARLVNRSGGTATVTLEYYQRRVGGNPSGASETADVTIAPNEQLVLDDMATELFGVTNGSGGVMITSDRELSGSARIFNDQRGAGLGTFGQWAQALSMSDALTSGTVQFMSNENPDSGAGFRGNIGWFNPNESEVDVVLTAWDTAGANLGSLTWTAGPYEQYQRNLGQLWSALEDYGNMYLTFTASAQIFVYGSLVDNVNGDAIYVPAN